MSSVTSPAPSSVVPYRPSPSNQPSIIIQSRQPTAVDGEYVQAPPARDVVTIQRRSAARYTPSIRDPDPQHGLEIGMLPYTPSSPNMPSVPHPGWDPYVHEDPPNGGIGITNIDIYRGIASGFGLPVGGYHAPHVQPVPTPQINHIAPPTPAAPAPRT